MSDDHDGNSIFLINSGQKLQNGTGSSGIQCAGRLIAQQDSGIHGESAGDCHPLLLSAGKLCRIGVRLFLQLHDLQKLSRLLPGLLFLHPEDFQRKAHIIQHRSLHQQIEMLKNHRHAVAHLPKLFIAAGRQIHTVDQHGSFRGLFQKIQTPHQRALSCSRHADDAVDIPFSDIQADLL